MKKIINQILFIFPRRQKIYFIFLFFMMFIGAGLELMGVSLILPFVQMVMVPETIYENAALLWFYNLIGVHSPKEFILVLTIGLILIYIAKNLYLLWLYKVQYRLVYNNQARVSAILIHSYMDKPYEYHLNQNTSNIVRSITQDVTYLFTLITSALSLLSEAVIAVMLCIFLMLADFAISITVIILLLFCMAFILLKFRKSLNHLGEENQRNYSKMIQWINQAMGGLKEIKVMQRDQFFVDAFIKNANKYAANLQKNGVMLQIPRLLIETVCVSGVLFVIALRIMAGAEITSIVPQLSVFAMAAFRLLPSITRMSNYYNQIMFYKSSIDLIYQELKANETISAEEDMADSQIPPSAHKEKSLEICHVSFGYSSQDQPVLDDISLSIAAGDSIGLIGMSGSGKTTLADLILGVLKPKSGTIFYNGRNIGIEKKYWSKKVGYIPQTIYLMDDSIQNNIAFGLCEEEIEEKKVWEALKQAQLEEFVRGLPNSLHTVIGERGVRLSGGQRQRIGIARALYHNPEVLILDEATSALDTETEQAVMEAIDSFSGQKTMIIIAHRISTTEKCKKIYKIDKGKLKEADRSELFPVSS